jgi:hypothetical protein
MRIYSVLTNSEPLGTAYTSLRALCGDNGIPYRSALKGKTEYIISGKLVKIYEINLVRIKGRHSF